MQMLPNPGSGGNDNKNLALVLLLCAISMLGYNYYMASQQAEQVKQMQQRAPAKEQQAAAQSPAVTPDHALLPTPIESTKLPSDVVAEKAAQNTAALPRKELENERYKGAVSLKGGRLDTLTMTQLQDKKHSEGEAWFTTVGEHPQYIDTGWMGSGIVTPAPDAMWQATGQQGNEIRLAWSNNQGQVFERTFTLKEENYMITVTDRVTNQTDIPVSLQHYAQIVHGGENYKGEQSTWLTHFGPVGVMDGILVEEKYKDVAETNVIKDGRGGWWGISSKYFLTAIGAPQESETVRRFNHTAHQGKDLFTAVVQRHAQTVQPYQSLEIKTDVYVGPKSVQALANVGYGLDRAVDYGWLSALAKPMYHILLWLHGHLGNWGLAIIGLTLLLKIVTFPLTYKSFAAMAKMKKLQPVMKEMQEKYKDEREKMAAEMMNLYKKEKVSPLSGCWPILVQMPIFFAMYKVMLISFEFRGAPFFGWITDLSLQDPYYVLPLLMGASMWVQMQLNPQAGDPMQQQIMKFLPVIFTVFFLFFPSGLVLYWLTNNLISIAQQWYMLKREGVQ